MRPRSGGEVGALYASHAAVALAGAQQAEHIAEAVDTRDLIGRAKGVLMQRHHIAVASGCWAPSSNNLRIISAILLVPPSAGRPGGEGTETPSLEGHRRGTASRDQLLRSASLR